MPRNPFLFLHTVTGDLYRPPAMSGNPPTRGLPVLVTAGVKFSPFYPLSAAVIARTNFERPHELKQAYSATKAVEGDTVIRADDGVSYTVVSVAELDWRPGALTQYEIIFRQARS